VLSGLIKLRLDHEVYELESGDSACFPSNVPHMFENAEKSVARLIWMTAEPQPVILQR
jgi:quercetin dioxygenase-like cupin family protein